MGSPITRSFKTSIDTRFPEVDEVPVELQEWYKKTQENLERMNDRVGDLEEVDVTTITDFRQNITNIEATALGFNDEDAINDFLNALDGSI